MTFRPSRGFCIGGGTIVSAVSTIKPCRTASERWRPAPNGCLVGSRPARSSSHRDDRAVLRMRDRSPMRAFRGLAAKCPTDGFRELLARFRADRPGGGGGAGFWAKGGLARKRHHPGRHFDATLFPSLKRGSHRPTGLPAAGRAEHPDAPWALAPSFSHPTTHTGGNGLRASPVRVPVR